MKKDNKIALILICFIIVFILTFILCGGLDAIIELLNILAVKSEEVVGNLIDFFQKILDFFNV